MSKTVICIDVHGKTKDFLAKEVKWRPAAYGIVIKDSKILLSKQFGNRYDLPGGGVDLNETMEEAVIREVKEETGIDVKSPKFIDMKESFFWDSHSEGVPYHCLMFYYFCEYVGGKLSTDGFDEWEKEYAQLAEWISLEKLGEIDVASSVDYRLMVKKALKL